MTVSYDSIIYYLRHTTRTEKIGREKLALLLLNSHRKRDCCQLRDEDEKKEKR